MRREEKINMDIWIIIQVFAFGAFLSFSSYLTYRQRTKQIKKLKQKQAMLV